MATVNISLPVDGDTIDAADYNTPITTIVNELNGNLSNANIATSAAISGSKLADASITNAKLDTTLASGWVATTSSVSSVTANGNRSYTVVTGSDLSSVVSPGMRLRTTRTVAAPTQSTSLNGSSQYYSKSSPAGMTFTDDFVVSAWVKLRSYPGSAMTIASRYNGTSGWDFNINADGTLRLVGFNNGSTNNRMVTSYQSIPLGKWVHVAAQEDMSTHSVGATNCYVMIDGVDVPAFVTSNGTNPTSLLQAGNLEIGGRNGGLTPFDGKIAQVAIYSAKVTQANVRATISQGLSGSESSLISAYSFNNSINDLNTSTANNLTANGSAVATEADSPFGIQANGTISSTLDYGIVQAINSTTITVQVPEGCTIPTSGGVSAVAYSTYKVPFGFPSQRGKWRVECIYIARTTKSTPVTATAYNNGEQITIPIGAYNVGYSATGHLLTGSSGSIIIRTDLNTSAATYTASSPFARVLGQITATEFSGNTRMESHLNLAAATPYYLNIISSFTGTGTTLDFLHDLGAGVIFAENAYL